MDEQSPKTLLVTGGGRRIGRAISLALAKDGWQVAVHFNNSLTEANEVVNEIINSGNLALAVQADLTDEDAVKSLIANISKKLAPVTAIINNASIFEEDSVESSTKSSWDNHLAVNLRAPFLLTQSLVENLNKDEKGNIINILDQRVENLTPYFISYTLSKSALWTLTKTTAAALAPNIRVNAIGPGPTLPSARQSQIQFDNQVADTPLETQVDVDEICKAVRFILDTPSMTGQLLSIDAGQHLGWAQPGQSKSPNE
ncbi:MAG: SDR family oxidoreductase [Pseudomonadota bacterium]|nr:SDR family oxidoreductase [Pseudomonadota bacterium]